MAYIHGREAAWSDDHGRTVKLGRHVDSHGSEQGVFDEKEQLWKAVPMAAQIVPERTTMRVRLEDHGCCARGKGATGTISHGCERCVLRRDCGCEGESLRSGEMRRGKLQSERMTMARGASLQC